MIIGLFSTVFVAVEAASLSSIPYSKLVCLDQA